ncbi:class I SAM-dependent methyltransferase [Halosimplex amylolyticum]|uniref:class I SAM-dependent methyltransferase n=1 Tax=Halosimplex amylolyticum TaxID=3396616 RepID=UPI003F575A94
MRQFSADYLETTREGMWGDSREALADLDLDSRERVLDVGCGTGELTRVLAEESGGEVVGADVDPELLSVAAEFAPVVRAAATRLPFAADAFDLVVCQALLINLPDPVEAVREFARASSDLVAAVEPDNGAVTVDSTVDAEPPLARRARERFLDGVATEVTMGSRAREVFEDAGLDVVSTRRYDHERVVSPPYSEAAVEAARRKVTGEGLADDRETILSGETTAGEYDELRSAWRAMGRDVVSQMGAGSYVRKETVPFFVTVGRV